MKVDIALDFIEHAFLRFTVITVLGVNPSVVQSNLNTCQRQTLTLRIHAQCDGRSRS